MVLEQQQQRARGAGAGRASNKSGNPLDPRAQAQAQAQAGAGGGMSTQSGGPIRRILSRSRPTSAPPSMEGNNQQATIAAPVLLDPTQAAVKKSEWKTASDILRDMGLWAPIYPHRNPIGFLAGMNVFAMPFHVDIGLSIKGNIHFSTQLENQPGANGSVNRGWRYNTKAEELFREYHRRFPSLFALISEGITDPTSKDNPTINANNYVVGLDRDTVSQIAEWIQTLKLPSIKTKGTNEKKQPSRDPKESKSQDRTQQPQQKQQPAPVSAGDQRQRVGENDVKFNVTSNEKQQQQQQQQQPAISKKEKKPQTPPTGPAKHKPPPHNNNKPAPTIMSEKKKLAQISDFIDELLKKQRKQRKQQRKQELKVQQEALNPSKAKKKKRDNKKKRKKDKDKEKVVMKKGIKREGPRKPKLSRLKKIILRERELLAAESAKAQAAATSDSNTTLPSVNDETATASNSLTAQQGSIETLKPEQDDEDDDDEEEEDEEDDEEEEEEETKHESTGDEEQDEEDGSSSSSSSTEEDPDGSINDLIGSLSIEDIVVQLGLDLDLNDTDEDDNMARLTENSSNQTLQAADLNENSSFSGLREDKSETEHLDVQIVSQPSQSQQLQQQQQSSSSSAAQIPSGEQKRQQREKKPPPQPVRREYCTQEISPALNKVVEELLPKLWTFQTRLKKNEPQKFNAKKRYVLGLRQVMRGVVANTIKTVVFAPNIEKISAPGGLDTIVNLIIKTCHENGINVVFALSKKRLGRATKSRVPISCVGIYSSDGALDLYKRMLRLAEDGRGQYANLQRQRARAALKASSQTQPSPSPATPTITTTTHSS